MFHLQRRKRDLYQIYEVWTEDLFVVRLPSDTDVVPWGPTREDRNLHEDYYVPLQHLYSQVQQWCTVPGETEEEQDEDDLNEDIDSADEDEASLLDKLDDMAIARTI